MGKFLGSEFFCGSYCASRLLPGAPGQEMHLDYPYWDFYKSETFPLGLNSSFPQNCQVTIPLDECSALSGATGYIPGSQKKLHYPNANDDFSNKQQMIGSPGDIIFLYGEIGVGKTTFVRFLINHLEVKNNIQQSEVLSPTFNIVYDYDIGNIKILHYDLYRLKNYKDISQLGMFETSDNSIKIVEWPELIEAKPKNRVDIQFQYSKFIDYRKVKIIGFGKWKDYKFNAL